MTPNPTRITAPAGTPFIEVVREFDARSGGSYRYVHTDADGAEYPFRGVFHTVSEAQIIQTFEFEDVPGVVSLETRTLDDLGDRTRLHQNAVFPSVAARDQALESGMRHGITESMDRLGELLGARTGQR